MFLVILDCVSHRVQTEGVILGLRAGRDIAVWVRNRRVCGSEWLGCGPLSYSAGSSIKGPSCLIGCSLRRSIGRPRCGSTKGLQRGRVRWLGNGETTTTVASRRIGTVESFGPAAAVGIR